MTDRLDEIQAREDELARLRRAFWARVDQLVPKGDPAGFAEPAEFPMVRDSLALASDLLVEVKRLRGVVEAVNAALQFKTAEKPVIAVALHKIAAAHTILSVGLEEEV